MNSAIFKARRENLARLVLDRFEGNRAEMSRKTGVHANHINLLLTDNETHRRNLGEDLARKIEAKLALTPGWLDHERKPGTMGETAMLPAPATLPEELVGALRANDEINSICLYAGWLHAIQERITAPKNLLIAKVSTHDMEPAIAYGEHVVVDSGVKAVTGDGVYVIHLGGASVLRRFHVLLGGGWRVSGPSGETVDVPNLKGIKVVGRIMKVYRSISV